MANADAGVGLPGEGEQPRSEDRVVNRGLNGALIGVAKFVGPTTPVKATAWFLWLFGLYAMIFATAPIAITSEMQKSYDTILSTAMDEIEERGVLLGQIRDLDGDIRERTGGVPFFWRFSEQSDEVWTLYGQRGKIESQISQINAEIASIESDAKAQLGLWSTAGVGEVRNKFWQRFEAGKRFGKQQTMMDAFFSIFSQRRDEQAMQFIIRWVFTILFNFTIGFVMTLITFLFTVVSVIRSFQPSLASAVAFYTVAGLGAASVVVGAILLMVGISGGTIYVGYKVVSENARIQGAQRRYVRNRPHVD